MAKSYRLKVIDHRSFGCDFPTTAQKATVLEVVDPLNVIFQSFAYPKGTSLCQDASFEPSTINIGSGVRPVDVRKKKIGKGREGKGREGQDG